jgi:spore maturation protein CgeB
MIIHQGSLRFFSLYIVKRKLLIIGNTSAEYHLGAMLVRAAEVMDLSLTICDTNGFAPSINHLWGKLFNRISGRRPLEWWSFNGRIAGLIRENRPSIVLVTGIFPLIGEVFRLSRACGAITVNYLTDDPWNPSHQSRTFFSNIWMYDFIFSTKKDIIPDLLRVRTGGKVTFLPFGFDPFYHRTISAGNSNAQLGYADAVFIGGADTDRHDFLKKFKKRFQGSMAIYGGNWQRYHDLLDHFGGVIFGDDFCKVINGCGFNIGLVRRKNRDGHSMRTYEIPACGGVGIYEDTEEHREIFRGYPEHGFFVSPDDAADKCNWLMENRGKLDEMRQLGVELVRKDSNTYNARLSDILAVVQ